MSIISALVKAYEHIPNAPQPGFSKQKISAVFVLRSDGTVAEVADMRIAGKKKPGPAPIDAPNPPKRSSGIISGFLWDKTSYALGLTKNLSERTAKEHEFFITYHQDLLAGTEDEGLKAFLAFLQNWNPEAIVSAPPAGWSDDLLDENIIFILESDYQTKTWLHMRPVAKNLWAQMQADEAGDRLPFCPIIGAKAPTARLHPSIKGIFGGQSSGTSLISYNKDSFTSYGHEQGDNAQISVAAAEAYTGALNLFLAKGSGHNMLIGDTTLVFWAEAQKEAIQKKAEESFAALFSDAPNDKDTREQLEKQRMQEISSLLDYVRKGKSVVHFDDELEALLQPDVRFYILGLAPNAARIVVRFFMQSNFGHIIDNYRQFIAEMRIEPAARTLHPPFYQYLLETALLHKRENVNPRLAAEWLQAVLTGQLYPQALLSTVLERIARERGQVNALRASILKAALMRNFKRGEVKAMLDVECHEKGYLFGRLFAVYERMQTSALGSKVNATVKDKFYSAAMVQPQKIFAVLERNSNAHYSKLRKEKPGYAITLERIKSEILGFISARDGGWPMVFSPEQQALFCLGYYHQNQAFFEKKSEKQESFTENEEQK